jgi:hypothetical protein
MRGLTDSTIRLRWFRQAGFLRRATARQLLALWHRLLNNFKFGKVDGGMGNGELLRVISAEACNIARANLHRPQRRLALDLDNFGRADVFHVILLFSLTFGFLLTFFICTIVAWTESRGSANGLAKGIIV